MQLGLRNPAGYIQFRLGSNSQTAVKQARKTAMDINLVKLTAHRKVRSGIGAYAGAARRRVHLATKLLRPPSGHRPGRRQARHAHILQIGLHLK